MQDYFKITPRIIAHLGEDLIKNESIAVLELVKTHTMLMLRSVMSILKKKMEGLLAYKS